MTARAFRLALATATLAACGRGATLDTRTFELKYLDAERAGGMIEPYIFRDRPGAAGAISIAGNVMTVRETPDNLRKIASVLAEYDQPRPAVRLAFRVIEADGSPIRDSAIADVEAVLRGLFRFRGYRLAAEGVVVGVEGGNVLQTLGGASGRYRLLTGIRHVRGSGDSATVQLSVQFIVGGEGTVLTTDVRLPVGKTAVLGNARAEPRGSTLILTVQPELVRASP